MLHFGGDEVRPLCLAHTLEKDICYSGISFAALCCIMKCDSTLGSRERKSQISIEHQVCYVLKGALYVSMLGLKGHGDGWQTFHMLVAPSADGWPIEKHAGVELDVTYVTQVKQALEPLNDCFRGCCQNCSGFILVEGDPNILMFL